MQKKRSTKFQLTPNDIVIGSICLIGMLISLFFFLKTFYMTIETDKEPIGVIYFKKNTTQRRLENKNLWERIYVSAPIYNGDRIRTGDSSEAVIVLNDSTEISLYDNTLVQIFAGDGTSLDFTNGSISVVSGSNVKDTGETVKIISGDKIFSLAENTSAVISVPKVTSVEENKDAVIAVSSGEIFVKPLVDKKAGNNTVRYETVEAGTVAQYDIKSADESVVGRKTLKTESNDIEVLMPVPSYTLAQEKDDIKFVPFFWTEESDIRIEFSYNQNFSKIINTEYLSSDAHKGSVSLDFVRDGEAVYWRVIPLKEKVNPKKRYASGKIYVQSTEVKQKDMQKAISAVFGEEKAAEITAKVEEKSKVIEKKEEVAMAEVVKNLARTDNSKNNESSKYQEQNKTDTYISDFSESDETTLLTIKDIINLEGKTAPDFTPADVSITEKTNSESEKTVENQNEEIKTTQAEETIENIEPKEVENNKVAKKVEIKKKKPRRTVVEQSSSNQSVVGTQPEEIIKTESIDEKKEATESLKKIDEKTEPIVELENTTEKIVSDSIVEKVQEEELKLPRFSRTKYTSTGKIKSEEESPVEEAKIPVSVSKELEAALTKVENDKNNGTIDSESGISVVPSVPEIINKSPKLLSPIANKSFTDDDFTTEEPSIIFKWAEVPDAQAYKFELVDNSDNVLWSTTVRTNRFKLSENIDLIGENGTYKWKVTAIKKIDGEVYSSKTASRSFNILIAPPEAVTGITSKNSIVFE